MKKLIALFAVVLLMASCSDNKTINGVTYEPYGLMNENEKKCDSIEYCVPAKGVICGIIFSETIIVPVYIFGYTMYEPLRAKKKVK